MRSSRCSEREPAHGYTLKRQYDARFAQTRPLAFGQVYASLARFEKQGWASVTEVAPGEGPDRKRYRITPEGVEVIDSWVFEPQAPDVFSTSSLFARVSVALMSGAVGRDRARQPANRSPGPDARADRAA